MFHWFQQQYLPDVAELTRKPLLERLPSFPAKYPEPNPRVKRGRNPDRVKVTFTNARTGLQVKPSVTLSPGDSLEYDWDLS
jgi:hypothetical protein